MVVFPSTLEGDMEDVDDLVALTVASAMYDGQPIAYAIGPLSDRRALQAFAARGMPKVPKDVLCASINRLCKDGAIERHPTGEFAAAAGICGSKQYPVVELILPDRF